MSERTEYITVYDNKLKKEVEITRKMQSILPSRYQLVGEAPQVQKKNPVKGAAPAEGKKPKIIRNNEG